MEAYENALQNTSNEAKQTSLIHSKNEKQSKNMLLSKKNESNTFITLYNEPNFDGEPFEFYQEKVKKIVMSYYGLIELYEYEKEPSLTLPFTIGLIFNKAKDYYLLYETSDNIDEILQFSGDVLDTGFRENKQPKLTIIYVMRALVAVSPFLHSNTYMSLDTVPIEQPTPIR